MYLPCTLNSAAARVPSFDTMTTMSFSFFLVVVIHARIEGAELVLALAPLALIDVVDDVVGQEGDHASLSPVLKAT